MHHFGGSNGTDFNYNSDLSGKVSIQTREGGRLDVPGRDLIEFVTNLLAQRRIAMLEQMQPEEVLGIKR